MARIRPDAELKKAIRHHRLRGEQWHGVWRFTCPTMPDLAAKHDGAADESACCAEFESRAVAARADTTGTRQPSLFDDGEPPAPPLPALENPIAHAADPDTSAEAARLVTDGGTRARHAAIVLALVRLHPGSTAIELMAAQGDGGLTEYQIRRRLTDLKEARAVEQCAARACRVRGTKMVTWRAAARGTEAA